MSTDQNQTSTTNSQTYIYDPYQYYTLKHATIISASMSLASTLLVILCFSYLQINYPEKANRVSLRCVFIACVMKLIDSVFYIAIVTQYGDTGFCRGSNIVIMFSGVMCATFLAIVGINLVLVFVFHVKVAPRKLEWIYYPCGVFYSIVTLVIPFIEMMHDPWDHATDYLCFYYINYFQINGKTSSSWLVWYGFAFFTVVVAVICSVIATIKLLMENHNLLGKFQNIADTSASVEVSKSHVQHRKENQTNIFLKVVSRCILYTLVPFVSNICGFVLQLILANPALTDVPSFELAVADTVMSCLEGVFIASIFMGDPVMTTLISKKYKAWKLKYLDEYTNVRKFPDGQVEMIHPHNSLRAVEEEGRKCSVLSIHNNNKANSIVSPPATIHMNSFNSNLGDTNGYFKDIENARTNNQSTIMPMRRVMVSPAIFNRLTHLSPNPLAAGTAIGCDNGEVHIEDCSGDEIMSHPATIFDSGASTTVINSAPSSPTWFIDLESVNSVLIPYKYPRMASAIHWLLVHLGFKKKSKRNSSSSSFNVPEELENIIMEFSPPIPGRMPSVQQQLT